MPNENPVLISDEGSVHIEIHFDHKLHQRFKNDKINLAGALIDTVLDIDLDLKPTYNLLALIEVELPEWPYPIGKLYLVVYAEKSVLVMACATKANAIKSVNRIQEIIETKISENLEIPFDPGQDYIQ